MARWKKTSIETKAKIIEAKINTDAQWSDIAEELWIPERTVQHILNTEFAEVCGKCDAVADLVTRNNNLQSAADALIAKMIAEEHESVTVAQLTTLRQSTFTQNQLITWKATEIVEVNWYDTLRKIKNWEITRDEAYTLLNQESE